MQPSYAEAIYNLGKELKKRGRLEEAIACYMRTVVLRPDWAETHNDLGSALLDGNRLDESINCYGRALAIKPDYVVAHNNLLMVMNYLVSDPKTIFAEHVRWGNRHGRAVPAASAPTNQPDPERRLRIGYISPDFRTHSVNLFFEPILTNHNPIEIETYCYSDVLKEDRPLNA